MNAKRHFVTLALVCAVSWFCGAARADTTYSEDFTGGTTQNNWYFFNGACLTSSSASIGTNPGQLPGCLAVKAAYYFNENLVGGQNGVSGNSQTLPDPAGQGALRFTNGYPFGHNEGGAIISSNTFDTSNGVQITFKSITYRGDSGGGVGDGADGISFFLLDGSVSPSLGSQGGSLGYTCSNPGNIGGHPIIDGVLGGYLGLGIDEYGNFLNAGDNTASGFGYQGNRIGLRGAGNVTWRYLNAQYPSYYPSALTSAQQQAAVAKTCQTGYLWNYSVPASPTAVLTAGETVTGTVSGRVRNGRNTVDRIPSIPASLIVGATITNQYIPSSPATTVTAITPPSGSTTTYTLTLSANATVPGSCASPCNQTLNFSSTSPGQNVYIPDYGAIPGGYTVLSGVKIANESAMNRGAATPIFYNLKITQDGLLSLSYSLSGAAYIPIITRQSITDSNGPLPSSFRFGFAGSTGGSTNIHEIMCFKAAPANQSGSSTSVNEKQAAKVETGTQAYFAFYNGSSWTGRFTANSLIDTGGIVTVNTTANWDASCVLTGTDSSGCTSTGAAGPTAAQTPSSRTIMTWDAGNSTGIPFEFSNLTSQQKAALNFGDGSSTSNRLNYLRGVRTNEINTSGVGLYRTREGILGDIVDSSPAWVGPPSSPYTATWQDRLYPMSTAPETSYASFVSAQQTRLNVVYVGANDGFLHGFRTGSFDASGTFVNNSSTPNDGREVLAYMPGSTLFSGPTGATDCSSAAATGSVVQNIHGVTPDSSSNPLCSNVNLDYSNTQYGHNFFVDATPGTGDLFYPDSANPSGAWHTWLVGGLGPGGRAIYALDVTSPGGFAETSAASVVAGEWTPSTLSCSGNATCGTNLGNTYGTPQIRRFHNGAWGVVFGNGFGSSTGDAGIFVMTIDPSNGNKTFRYLSTGRAGSNGIAYATGVDLDNDHITDYVYAGDLLGNVWRFDLTSSDPSNWAAASSPLFTTAGQPITSKVVVIASAVTGSSPRVMVEFGTGRRVQLTNETAVSYSSGAQDIYGVWDWNMSAWNGISSAHFASMSAAGTGLSSPYTLAKTNLTQQVFTINSGTGVRDGTNNPVCWKDATACGTNDKFGWYVDLPGGSEQIIFNPVFFQGAFIVDSTIPANNTPTSCRINTDTGFTYAISASNGGTFANVFPRRTDTQADPNAVGVETDATGTPYIVTTAEGTTNLVYQTVSGTPGAEQVNLPPNTKSKRLTWVELR